MKLYGCLYILGRRLLYLWVHSLKMIKKPWPMNFINPLVTPHQSWRLLSKSMARPSWSLNLLSTNGSEQAGLKVPEAWFAVSALGMSEFYFQSFIFMQFCAKRSVTIWYASASCWVGWAALQGPVANATSSGFLSVPANKASGASDVIAKGRWGSPEWPDPTAAPACREAEYVCFLQETARSDWWWLHCSTYATILFNCSLVML